MRPRTHRLPLVLSAAVALSLATAVAAGAETAVDSEGGTLTAVVASVSGRAITSVVSPVATVVNGAETISTGTPATVIVEEVNAKGASWNVKLTLDDDLKSGNDVIRTKDKVAVTSQTTPVVVLPLLYTPTITNLTTPASLDAAATLFAVTNQSTAVDYTAVYTSLVPFTVDATGYTGPVVAATADFTVTVYQ